MWGPSVLRQQVSSGGLRKGVGLVCLGAVLALGHAPVSFPFASLLALPLLGWIFVQTQTPRQAAVSGMLAGFAYFALALSWIVEPFLVDARTYGWMAPFALFFVACGGALFWAGPFWAACRFGRTDGERLILLAIFLTLSEYLRAHIFTGFPWGMLAYVWIDTPIIQMVSVIGPYGLSLLLLLLGFLPVIFAQKWILGALISLTTLAGMAGFGLARQAETPLRNSNETVVRVVQPNAEQHLKWQPDMMRIFFERQLNYSALQTEKLPDLVIWPETALPFPLGRDPEAMELIANAQPEALIIAGIRRWEGPLFYNSLVAFDAKEGVRASYDKHHLVPFGEFIPFGDLLGHFGLRGLAAQDGNGFSGGEGPHILSGLGVPPFLPLICYEAIFPHDLQAASGRADWILHLTNDAWFGTLSGPYQHLDQVKIRAIEQGLPVVRAANTGISAVIDPFGRIEKSIGLGQQGYFDWTLPAPLAPTPYSQWQELPWLVFCAFLALAIGFSRYWRRN